MEKPMEPEIEILDLKAQLEEALDSQNEMLSLLVKHQGLSEHYQNIFNLSASGQLIISPNGKISNANIKAHKILSRKAGRLIGKSLFSFLGDAQVSGSHEILMDHLHYVKTLKTVVKCEIIINNKWCALHSFLLSNNVITITIIDISIRKKLEAKVYHGSTHD